MDEWMTKEVLATPITPLARFIVRNWVGSPEALAELSGVSVKVICKALESKEISKLAEKKLRETLSRDCRGNQSEGDYYDEGAQAQDRRFI